MRYIYFLMLIMVLSVGSASAFTFTGFKDLHSVGMYVPVSGSTANPSTVFMVCDDTNVSVYDTLGGVTSENALTNFPSDAVHAISTGTKTYVILYNGYLYEIDQSIGSRSFSVLNFAPGGNAKFIGDMGSDGYNHRLVYNDGKLYVYEYGEGKIYQVNLVTYTYTEFETGLSHADIAAGPDGLYVVNYNSTTKVDLRKYTAVDTYTNVFVGKTIGAATTLSHGLYVLDNDNFIITALNGAITDYIYEVNSTGSTIGTIYSGNTYLNDYIPQDYGNVYVTPSGIVVFTATKATMSIVTFNTATGAGGYYISETGLSSAQIDYSTSSIMSEYATYFNVSSVTANYNIAIEETWYDNAILTYDPFTRYAWKVELWGPDEVSLNTYYIPEGSNWKRESYWLGIVGQGDMQTIGSITYPQIAANGTYQLRLYELNTVQGTKALLDTYEFEVLDITNPASSGTVPVNNDASVAFTSFLGSPAFIGMILFVGIAVAVGKDRKGQIHGTGIIIGAVIGCIVLVMAGLFPVWTIYVIVLVSLVMLGKSMIGMGGG